MVLLKQPVWRSAAYAKNDKSGPLLCLLRNSPMQQSTKLKLERLLAAQAEQDKVQPEQDKVQAWQSFQDSIESVKEELAKEMKDIKCDSTVLVGKITSSSKEAQDEGRFLQVHDTDYEGEMQWVSKNDGGN